MSALFIKRCLGCRCEHQELPVPPRAGHPAAVCLATGWLCHERPCAGGLLCSPVVLLRWQQTCSLGGLGRDLPRRVMGFPSRRSVWANMVGKDWGANPSECLDSHSAKTELGDIFHLRLFIPGGKKKKISPWFSGTKMFYEFMPFPLSSSFRQGKSTQ